MGSSNYAINIWTSKLFQYTYTYMPLECIYYTNREIALLMYHLKII